MPFAPSTPDVTDATRREFLALLGAAGLLAGCGGAAEEPAAPATRRFAHAAGTTDVPTSPSRIVSLHSTAFTWQLATLGVASIGASAAPAEDPLRYIRLVDPQAAAALDGLVSVGDSEVDLEKVAALRPDLIVGGDFQSDLYDRLSAIAPTVLLSSDLPNGRYFGVQGALADLTGTTARLAALHDAYEARVAALRDRYADRWAALDWLALDDYEPGGGAYLVNLTADTPAHRVFTDLGARLAAPARRYATGEGYVELSEELLSDLDADVMFVTPPFDVLAGDPAALPSGNLVGLVATSAAAAAGQVLPVGLAWTNTNVASLGFVLDDLERFLAARPDGFFATSYES